MASTVKFAKMHGAGNDYIYIYDSPIADPVQMARRWSDRHKGIGSDGLVLIDRSKVPEADFAMRIFNADGSEARMCGNASRCIGKYVYENGLTDKDEVLLDTLSGVKVLRLYVENGEVNRVSVDMGVPADIRPVFLGDGYPFAEGMSVSMGNPHLVIFVDDVSKVDVAAVGSRLECHPFFPDRVNVEFAQVIAPGKIRMRVWERGSGVTQACGTGACATAVAAFSTGRGGEDTEVVMDGGALQVSWTGPSGHLFMTGPAVKVFEGKIEV